MRRLADGADVGQLQVGDALLQPLDQPIDALAGGVVAALRRFARIDVGMSDDGDGLVDVVEDDHAVVEGEAEIRQTAIVRRRVRQALDIADRVVAGIADGAAAEARQARQRAARDRPAAVSSSRRSGSGCSNSFGERGRVGARMGVWIRTRLPNAWKRRNGPEPRKL